MFCTRQQVACEMFICYLSKAFGAPCRKKLSLVVFDSNCSFKMVKCSFFNQIVVYQSFYGAPLTFNYVLLQGKVLCSARVGKSLVRCLLSEAADQTWWKKLYLRSYLTQIVHSNGKMLFLAPNNCASLTFFKEKFLFRHAFPSRLLRPCLLVSKKCYLSVVFAA